MSKNHHQSSVLDQVIEEYLPSKPQQNPPTPPLPPPPADDHRDDEPDDQRPLTKGEAAYWRRVVAQASEANQHLQQAQLLEAQATDLRQQATMKLGAYESYRVHLYEALGIDEATGRITPEGVVVRNDRSPR